MMACISSEAKSRKIVGLFQYKPHREKMPFPCLRHLTAGNKRDTSNGRLSMLRFEAPVLHGTGTRGQHSMRETALRENAHQAG